MATKVKEIQSLVRVKCWREQHAKQVLDIWRASDLSLLGFCRRYGIGYKRLLRWEHLLKEHAAIPFMQIESIPQERYVDDHMEVMLHNGRSIRIQPGFDPEALRRAIRVVEDGTCG